MVDLPEPVGPVTRTRPRGLSASSYSYVRHVQLLERADARRNHAEGCGKALALEERVDPEARQAGDRVREVEAALVSRFFCCSVEMMR